MQQCCCICRHDFMFWRLIWILFFKDLQKLPIAKWLRDYDHYESNYETICLIHNITELEGLVWRLNETMHVKELNAVPSRWRKLKKTQFAFLLETLRWNLGYYQPSESWCGGWRTQFCYFYWMGQPLISYFIWLLENGE
jgi:hypothetical protein